MGASPLQAREGCPEKTDGTQCIEGPDVTAPQPSSPPPPPWFEDRIRELIGPAPGTPRFQVCFDLLRERADLPARCQGGPLTNPNEFPPRSLYHARSAMGFLHRYLDRATIGPRNQLLVAMEQHARDRAFAFGAEARAVDEAFLSQLAGVCVAEGRVSVGGGNWPVDVCYTALSRSLFEVRGSGDWGNRTLDYLISIIPNLIEAIPQSRGRVVAGSLGAELLESYTSVPANSFEQHSQFVRETMECVNYWTLWNSFHMCGSP